MRMHTLLAIQHLWRGGGTETHVLALAAELKRKGHHVTIYTYGGPWMKRARSMGIHVHRHHGSNGRSKADVAEFTRYVRSRRFDVVHAHDPGTLRLAAAAHRQDMRMPRPIYTVHGTYIGTSMIREAGAISRALIAVSPFVRDHVVHVCRIPADKVFTIANGVDTSLFRPGPGTTMRTRCGIRRDAFVIGYASRFTFDKSRIGRRITDVLRRTAGEKDVHVLVAGRESNRYIRPSRHVHVLGHVSRMAEFCNACDVVVGTGRVAIEAALCGVPVICIGNAGYRGFVTAASLHTMRLTNFGDHGPEIGWSGSQLTADLQSARRHIHAYKSRASSLQTTLQDSFSARRMAERTLALYRLAR